MASKYAKRHYNDMAEYIRSRRQIAHNNGNEAAALAILDDAEHYWSLLYAQDNPLFDERRFRIACQGGES